MKISSDVSTTHTIRGRRGPLIVVVTLASMLVGLGVMVAATAGVAEGVHAAASRLTTPGVVPIVSHDVVVESMQIRTSSLVPGRQDWPNFTNQSWAVHVGEHVTLRIRSFDDGAAPLTGAQMMYDMVMGTNGGRESVDGTLVSSVANDNVSHTFTVVGLGLNIPIPAAPTGGSVTVVAHFVASRTGTFMWQCYAPCGTGANSVGGAMSTMSWMEGNIEVLP